MSSRDIKKKITAKNMGSNRRHLRTCSATTQYVKEQGILGLDRIIVEAVTYKIEKDCALEDIIIYCR